MVALCRVEIGILNVGSQQGENDQGGTLYYYYSSLGENKHVILKKTVVKEKNKQKHDVFAVPVAIQSDTDFTVLGRVHMYTSIFVCPN